MTALAVPHISFGAMQHTQRDTKQWIKAVADHLGMTVSQLARDAKLSPSTLTRYVNDPSGDVGISQRSLDAISSYSGIAPHQMPVRRAGGMSEPDAILFNYDEAVDAAFARAVRALCQERNGRDPWLIKGWGLDLLGYMPGDVVIVDLNLRARPGDVVCAQVYDWGRERAETVMRVFEPPYLLTSSSRLGIQKPLVVDDQNVIIRGVVGAMLRPARSAA